MAWPSNARAPRAGSRPPAASFALGVLIAGLIAGLTAGPALATPTSEANAKRLESTERFLQNAQNSDGGFTANGAAGEPSDPEFTAWAALALASAGINPQNQARPGGESAYGYLSAHADALSATTDFERVLLVVDAAGTSAQDFGGVDLIQAILARQLPEGGFSHEQGEPTPGINDTIFAILSLSPIPEPRVQEALARAVRWLEREQSADGSWPLAAGGGAPGDVDITAAAVEALNAADVRDSAAQGKAFEVVGMSLQCPFIDVSREGNSEARSFQPEAQSAGAREKIDRQGSF